MSKFKAGDLAKIKDSCKLEKGKIVEIIAGPDAYGIYKVKSEEPPFFFINQRHLELVDTKTEALGSKMLHELIEMARAGKKFMARRVDSACPVGYNHEHFRHCNGWSSNDVVASWLYEETREPRVVEFTADWTAAKHDDIVTMIKGLGGAKWKVVATEVIE